jgi:glycerol kinase
MSEAKRALLYKGWKKAVKRSLEWAKEDEEFEKELSSVDC